MPPSRRHWRSHGLACACAQIPRSARGEPRGLACSHPRAAVLGITRLACSCTRARVRALVWVCGTRAWVPHAGTVCTCERGPSPGFERRAPARGAGARARKRTCALALSHVSLRARHAGAESVQVHVRSHTLTVAPCLEGGSRSMSTPYAGVASCAHRGGVPLRVHMRARVRPFILVSNALRGVVCKRALIRSHVRAPAR